MTPETTASNRRASSAPTPLAAANAGTRASTNDRALASLRTVAFTLVTGRSDLKTDRVACGTIRSRLEVPQRRQDQPLTNVSILGTATRM